MDARGKCVSLLVVFGLLVVATVPARAGAPFGVGVTLGPTNVDYGLTQFDVSPDGVSAADNVGGKDCRKLVTNGTGARYLYLKVADWYYPPGAGPGVTVVVEYYGANNVPFSVQYDAADGNPYKTSTSRTTGSTGTWKKALFWLPDPRFAGSQNGGADLRIATSNDVDDSFIAGVALARPAGPYVKGDRDDDFSGESFGLAEKVVATHYFYWYDIYSREHFLDAPGDDALTDHPALAPGVPACEYLGTTDPKVSADYSYHATAYHRRELEDMMAAEIDVVMPVYWGGVDNMMNFAIEGLEKLVEAMDQMVAEGHNPPKVAMFFDTTTLQLADDVFNYYNNKSDLRTEDGRNFFIKQVVDFFSVIPPRYWARIDGKPVVVTYVSGWTSGWNQQAFDELDARFAEVFGGQTAYVIRDVSWTGVTTESSIRFGAALMGPQIFGAAAVGPGYNDSAVPGRGPSIRDRRGGQTYIDDWNYVIANYSGNFVAAETWSEFHEATEIAPSLEYGRQYVELTQEYASRFKGNWGGTDNAIVMDNTIPSTQYVGEVVTVSVTVKNTGSTTWSEAGGYRLGAVGDSDPFHSGTRVALPSGTTVSPGQTYTFEFSMTAPAAGSYVTDWRMVHDGVGWFGEVHREAVSVVEGTGACPREAPGNRLGNPDFEGFFGAKSASVTGQVPDRWRAFALNDSTGEISVLPVAANELYAGSAPTQAVRWSVGLRPAGGPGGDSGLDKWNELADPIQPDRVYRLLVDVKDGGTYGGSPSFVAGLQLFNGSTYQGGRSYGIDPGSAWETTGITVASKPDSTGISPRFDVGTGVGRSVLLDNARVHDVTETDRMVNGGFENSPSQLIAWRFFDTTSGNSAGLSSDAHSGANAALLVRNTTDGDTGLDLDAGDRRLAVLPGESLNVACYAKKVSGDADARLGLTVAFFDSNGAFLPAYQTGRLLEPGTEAYEQFLHGVTVPAEAAYMAVAFRVVQSSWGPWTGSYLIDDVVVSRQAIPRTGNMLADGDFEKVPFDGWGTEGGYPDNLYDLLSIPDWRAFAVNGAYGFFYGRSDAASSGLIGMEIGRTATGQGGDSALDKDDPAIREAAPANRVYQALVDVKDGGLYGGTPHLGIGLQGAQYPWGLVWSRGFGFDPGSDFETIGVTGKAVAPANQISVRLDIGGDYDRSAYVDNVRLYDVTYGVNRLINGGFENSSSRLLGWRFFAVSGAAGSATLSTDAHTGSYAARLERTVMDGDSGLDTWDSNIRIAALGGETVVMSFAAKWLSGDGRIGWNISTFDSNHTFLGVAAQGGVSPTGSYGIFSSGPVTLNPNVAYVSVGFRVWDAPSAFLIDDVELIGVEPTVPPPTNVLTNGDFEADPEGTQRTGHNFVDTTTFTAWRLFAVDGAAATMRIASEAASHGALGVMLARDQAVPTPGDAAFDNDLWRFELKPGLSYWAEFYVKTGNEDQSDQGVRFNFPVFTCQYVGEAAAEEFTATNTWQKVTVGPISPPVGATHAHVAWRVLSEGDQQNAILIAQPSVTARPVYQDADADGDVDVNDFAVFQACFNGPGRPFVGSGRTCGCFDADGDRDVDVNDFAVFQACFNGPGNPPACQ